VKTENSSPLDCWYCMILQAAPIKRPSTSIRAADGRCSDRSYLANCQPSLCAFHACRKKMSIFCHQTCTVVEHGWPQCVSSSRHVIGPRVSRGPDPVGHTLMFRRCHGDSHVPQWRTSLLIRLSIACWCRHIVRCHYENIFGWNCELSLRNLYSLYMYNNVLLKRS